MQYPTTATKPFVSVIMSCFNGETWLSEAIESILSQTFENFEFILIDDGSSDSTLDLIRHHSNLDKRVIVIAKPHTNLSDSLNIGLERASGKWVARLDQDDLSMPERLSEQVSYVSGHPDVVLLGSAFISTDGDDRIIKAHYYPTSHGRLTANLEHLKEFFPHSTAFFNLNLAKYVGGYRSLLNNANDHDLWLRLSSHGNLACLSKPLVKCRFHTRQMSVADGREPQLIEAVAGSLCHFIRKSGCQDPLEDCNLNQVSEFFDFVEYRVRGSGFIQRRRIWREAREAYFRRHNALLGLFSFFGVLMRSGNTLILVWEKYAGSSLPKKLAEVWLRKTKRRQLSLRAGQKL
jgi:glycosyltransferase involved in cell wall biosynthesis